MKMSHVITAAESAFRISNGKVPKGQIASAVRSFLSPSGTGLIINDASEQLKNIKSVFKGAGIAPEDYFKILVNVEKRTEEQRMTNLAKYAAKYEF
jgi:hypothetical protein